MVECTGFENRHTVRYQRFKSSHLRKNKEHGDYILQDVVVIYAAATLCNIKDILASLIMTGRGS